MLITYTLLFNIILALPNTPHVVVTIKPIHALVCGIMTEVGEPHLLLAGGESPHTYSMKPSQIQQLHRADLLIWIGDGVETFLQKPLANLDKNRLLRLDTVEGLPLLKVRTGGTWHAHHHHHHSTNHETETIDPHIWLDPNNAKIIIQTITKTLSQLDASHATQYRQNADQLIARLNTLDEQIVQQLAPLRATPFLVFHDAYQYFEQHYGLTAVGTVTPFPEQTPSAKRLHELRTQISIHHVKCVFSEPQFTSTLIATLLEDTSAKHGELDPIGATLPTGTEAYFTLLQNLANAFTACLATQ